jgi:TolB-like protein/class 3 adenylate cyclase
MTTRRLAAILAADVASFAALMERDEEGTFARIGTLRREVIEPRLSEHQGRLVKTTGDGFLIEFASPIAALRCALAIQANLTKEPDTLRLRIGLNLGDVIIEDSGDVYGEGVNVAARLEGLAEPGGILISDKIYREVEGKVEATFEDRGEQQVKNISRPVHVYAVRAAGSLASQRPATASLLQSPVLTLPDKPSIAVLPFQNMSGDAEQDNFADGMVEDITTALSRFKSLFVIARNSSFTYKGKAVDIKQVGRDLGVRYVLEGSVRKAGSRVRIAGQLIDATTGAHLWADRIDGALEDVFDLQDRVTQQVIGAIAPEIDRAEIERANRRPISSVDAVTEFYRGLPHVHRPTTPANNDAALQHFRNAIALDPNFLPAYGAAAICILWRRVNFWPSDIPKDDALLLSFAERIKELNTEDAFTFDAVGMALFYNALNIDVGRDLNERAIRSNPNFAPAYHSRGWFQVWDGGSDAAITDFEEHLRRSPRDPFAFNSMIGIAFAHYNASRYTEAAIWADKSIRAFPYFIGGLQIAITCYVEAGRIEDAHRVMAEVLRLHPKWSFSGMRGYRGPIRSPEVREKQWASFRKAGLPE